MEHTKFNEFVLSPDNPLFQSPDDDSLLEAAAAGGASTEPRARKKLTFNSPPTTEEQAPQVGRRGEARVLRGQNARPRGALVHFLDGR